MEVKKLLETTREEYDQSKSEVFSGEDFPAVASKVMVNKTLYVMDEILKYIQVYARLFIATKVLQNEGSDEEKVQLIDDLEEKLRERYPVHDNAPVLIGQAAQDDGTSTIRSGFYCSFRSVRSHCRIGTDQRIRLVY